MELGDISGVSRCPGAYARAIHIAAQIPHHPLRVYVMGDRAIKREAATADDIAAMRDAVRAGLQAGAFGFTTSRTNSHKTPAREWCPAAIPRSMNCWASVRRSKDWATARSA